MDYSEELKNNEYNIDSYHSVESNNNDEYNIDSDG